MRFLIISALIILMLLFYPGGLINAIQQTSSLFSKSGMAEKYIRKLVDR